MEYATMPRPMECTAQTALALPSAYAPPPPAHPPPALTRILRTPPAYDIEAQRACSRSGFDLSAAFRLRTSLDSASSSASSQKNTPSDKACLHRLHRAYRALRWRLLNIYRRLFGAVFCANAIALCHFATSHHGLLATPSAAKYLRTAAAVNLTAAITLRNEHIVNALFRLFVQLPSPALPLRLRRLAAKIYALGGVHSGAGVAGAAWYGAYTISTLRARGFVGESLLALAIWTLLFAMIGGAHPRVRACAHNAFEMSHRFCGWAMLVLFWLQTAGAAGEVAGREGTSLGIALMHTPPFWCLLLMTALVAYPWLQLRRVPVRAEKLSEHAVRLHLPGRAAACRTIRLSDAPLRETHAFAVIPEPEGEDGYSLVVSAAGDWTSRMVAAPPERLWIKGRPTWGVLRVAPLFSPVIIVATGSGIGPVLGLFSGHAGLDARIVWASPEPERTFGKGIVARVREADPRAIIVDTRREGRPDMLALALGVYESAKAEAVVVISNKVVTKRVVRGLEGRGVPAFGPIWDS